MGATALHSASIFHHVRAATYSAFTAGCETRVYVHVPVPQHPAVPRMRPWGSQL